MATGVVGPTPRRAAGTILTTIVLSAGLGLVASAPPAEAHDPAVAAALALERSRVALHPALLDEVGYPLYRRLQRMVGDRAVYVVILPSASDRLGLARELREIEMAAGRPGVYLLTLGVRDPERLVDVWGDVGDVDDGEVTDALEEGVDPDAGTREGLTQSVAAVVAAVDGRPVVQRTSTGKSWWLPASVLVLALVCVVVLRIRVLGRLRPPR